MNQIFVGEHSDSIDGKRYYYEMFLDCSDGNSLMGMEVRLTLRTIEPESVLIFNIDREDIEKWIDKKVEKIVEKHYQAHINYKGEADSNLDND